MSPFAYRLNQRETDSFAGAAWIRSSRCPSGSCVEVARLDSNIFALRDSKQAWLRDRQPTIAMSRTRYSRLLDLVVGKVSASPDDSESVSLCSGQVFITSTYTGVELRFDQDEIDAFVAGIRAGEFTPEALMQPVG